MESILVKKELLEEIDELREKLEDRLRGNKYYLALTKLDELLDAIRSLGIMQDNTDAANHPDPTDETGGTKKPELAEPALSSDDRSWTQQSVG